MKVLLQVSSERVPDLVSWQIMRRLKFDGSHVFIVIPEEDLMFHCVETGLRIDDYTKFCETHHITRSKEIELACTRDEFQRWFDDHRRTTEGYGTMQYLGFCIPIVKYWVRNARRKAICSEFVCWVLSDLGGYSNLEDSDFLSPKDVWNAVSGER